MNGQPKREVNSLLNYSDEIIFETDKDDDKEFNNNKKKDHSNHNPNNESNGRNKKDKKNKENVWNNPVAKIIQKDVYDKSDVYKALVKQDGLYKMIKDLKEWSKNPKHKKPNYIYHVLRDIVVAAALPSAIKTIENNDNYDIDKKDWDLLLDEILSVVRTSNDDQNLNRKYSEESIEAIREAYISILYKFNKKKMKKFKEINLDEGIAKKIIVLTAGKNPNNSIYALLRFLYNNSSNIELSEKIIVKIFKICYGKDSIPEVIKCIMNEKCNPIAKASFMREAGNVREESQMWVLIDKIMRDQLEDMGKKDREKTILAYIKERKIAKKRGDTSRRRFGDRRSIHPEDYPKLTATLEDLESDDFSIIEYLR